ncbi:hypothetical protein Zmor_010727 [Zophobas morio]|uniref:BZIP domain-containing protein n=1 Tax=Zophobas morio TaxID=2755281 RepID=A0AA38MK93_9CUCU|nr:hypothetical protein Zmor_010727 [Zophobas morio]
MATDLSLSSPDVLDLCTRKRPRSPDDQDEKKARRPPVYNVATCQYSPVSNSDSESCEMTSNSEMKTVNLKTTACRPFKAYTKDPLMLAQGFVSPETLLQKDSAQAFTEFRHSVLSRLPPTTNKETNQNMRRLSNTQNKNADPTYLEKRRKNNEAAKKSRDARRAKEDEMAIRCAFLEEQNRHLKYLTQSLKQEVKRLQHVVYFQNHRNV